MRREQNKRGGGNDRGGRKEGGKPMRGGKGGKRFKRKGGRPMPKDPAAKAEFLDKELENYYLKGGDKEKGKCFLNFD